MDVTSRARRYIRYETPQTEGVKMRKPRGTHTGVERGKDVEVVDAYRSPVNE